MKVSIVLTSYNHEKYIRESIESVLAQTFTDFELIIVDDCSSDGSWDIIKTYKDDRIKAVRNKKNLRTEGIENAIKNIASGEYLAIHHSDDLWENNKLEKQVQYLDAHKEISAVFTWAEPIDDEGNSYDDQNGFYYNLFSQPNRNRFEWLNHFFYFGNCLCHPSILMRRQLFTTENMFDFGYAQIPDMARWVRICLRHEIYIIPEKLTKFRIQKQGKNTSGDRPDTIIRSSVELYHMLKLYEQISTAEELLKVFPDAKPFVKDEYFNIKYSLGRYFTRDNMDSFTRLRGYELLYEVMNERAEATKVEQSYGYTFRNLIEMTGTRDIFGVLPEKAMQTSRIYLDFGNGFEEIEELKKVCYIRDYCKFEWKVGLPERLRKKPVLGIRFDPVEEIFIKFRMDEFKVDNKAVSYVSNAELEKEEYDAFISEDPMYIAKLDGQLCTEILIVGDAVRLSKEEQIEIETEKKNEYIDMVKERDIWLAQKSAEEGKLKLWLEQKVDESQQLKEERKKLQAWLQQKETENSDLLEQVEICKKEQMELQEELKKMNSAYQLARKRVEDLEAHSVIGKLIKLIEGKKK